MRELWLRAAEAVASAERIVLIGYSVPAADHSIMGLLSDGIQGRDVKIEVVNPYPSIVEERLIRLGASSDLIDSTSGLGCIADWTAAEVNRLARETVIALRRRKDLIGEVLMFASGPRVERFRSLDPPDDPTSAVVLHLNPGSLQLANPRMFTELRPMLDGCGFLTVEDEGQMLPVIDFWVREQRSGAMMTQLHLVVAGR